MRYFSHTSPSLATIYVDGLSSFCGEVASALAGDVFENTGSSFERAYNEIFDIVYDGKVPYESDKGKYEPLGLTPNEVQQCLDLRVFLQGLETGQGANVVFLVCNCNTGRSLTLIASQEE